MSTLREKIADTLIQHTRTRIEDCHCGWGVNTGALGQSHAAHVTDAVLRVLAEHGDTQQVREQLVSSGALVLPRGDRIVAVMAVVAPIVAARDAAIEQAKKAKRWLIDAAGSDVTDLLQSLDECTTRAERAEADLAELRAEIGGWQDMRDARARAEADLAAARMQVRVRDARLDQVRMIVLDPEFPDVKPDGPVMTKLRRILDAPAGYEAKERT
jgi:hypothetical protein